MGNSLQGAIAAVLVAGAIGTGAGCRRSTDTPVVTTAQPAFSEPAQPSPVDPQLALGQEVYRGDCATCHNPGKRGAPRIGNAEAWRDRLAQGDAMLIRHAIEGYLGPAGDEMPARGGNDALTDAQITAAVAYLLSHSR